MASGRARLKVGDRLQVYTIEEVTWPGSDTGAPVVGVVTDIRHGSFMFMPDLPDETSNGDSNGHEYGGWSVEANGLYEPVQYVIDEEPSLL